MLLGMFWRRSLKSNLHLILQLVNYIKGKRDFLFCHLRTTIRLRRYTILNYYQKAYWTDILGLKEKCFFFWITKQAKEKLFSPSSSELSTLAQAGVLVGCWERPPGGTGPKRVTQPRPVGMGESSDFQGVTRVVQNSECCIVHLPEGRKEFKSLQEQEKIRQYLKIYFTEFSEKVTLLSPYTRLIEMRNFL